MRALEKCDENCVSVSAYLLNRVTVFIIPTSNIRS